MSQKSRRKSMDSIRGVYVVARGLGRGRGGAPELLASLCGWVVDLARVGSIKEVRVREHRRLATV